MKRNAYKELLEWKENKNRKPLLVFGARQVGKSYLIKEFCNKEYKKFFYFDLVVSSDLVDLFENTEDFNKMVTRLKLMIQDQLDSEETILFIDEVQESPKFVTYLKYFNEDYPEINIICAGSLLGTMINRTKMSFPVGQVDYLYLNAMSFDEFLINTNNVMLKEEIEDCYNKKRPMHDVIHKKALDEYRNYLCIGGMPESIQDYINNDYDLSKHNRNIITKIVEDYTNDMSKYITSINEVIKIKRVYKSLSKQLLNNSKKFQYSKINKHARHRDYEYAIDWLRSSRLVLECNSITVPKLPLTSYSNDDIFKLYLSDIGILNTLLEIEYLDIINDKLDSYKGAISENYVAFHLYNHKHNLLYYNNHNDEVDFIIRDSKGNIIPIEVKYNDNTKSISLNNYIENHNPNYAIRISSKNFGFEKTILSIPLYAVYLIDKNISYK